MSRRRYTEEEKCAALYLVREVGVTAAARRLGISKHTLYDWKCETKACAYSPFVGARGRRITERERARLLAQLVHEQELEQRYIQRTYRHDPAGASESPLEPLDVLLTRTGVTQRHLVEWLDPTFDAVAERLAA